MFNLVFGGLRPPEILCKRGVWGLLSPVRSPWLGEDGNFNYQLPPCSLDADPWDSQ